MELDDIKAGWNALAMENIDLKQKNAELTRKLVTQKVIGNQQRFARSMRIGYVGFLFPLLAYALYRIVDVSVGVCILYAVYGWIVGFFDIWFSRYILKTDYAAVSTVKALDHALRILRYYYIATALSIVFCLIVIIPMFYELAHLGDNEAWIGGVAGGIFGAIIGGRKWMNNRKLARRIIEELRSIEE